MKSNPLPTCLGRSRSALWCVCLVLFISLMSMRAQAQSTPPTNPISFNGVDQYIKVPHDPKLDFTTGTIEMWLKPDWTTAPQNLCFMSMREQGPQTRFSLHMAANKSGIGLWNGTTYLPLPFTFANKTWYHVAFVMGEFDTEIFVNGVSRGFTGNTLNKSRIGYDLKIGISELVGTNSLEYFKGEMDEIRVWNVARTATEIQQNMAKSIPPTSLGLVAYFPIDANVQSPANSSTRLVTDQSANGLNGQLMNYFGPVPDANGIVYVKKNGAGNNAGSSWANAYAELAGALKEAKTNTAIKEIWVAEGNYRPLYSAVDNTGPNLTNRDNAFVLVSNVKLYGGFAGNETTLAQRNWKTHKTVLSGDLDGSNSISNGDAYHVLAGVSSSGTMIDNNVVVDGFTISGGNANQPGNAVINGVNIAQNSGGGLNLTTSNPILSNLIFEKNNAILGGALSNSFNSNSIVSNTLFINNSAQNGGAVYIQISTPTFLNVTVSGNTATSSGGGIYDNSPLPWRILNSIIWGNKVNNDENHIFASLFTNFPMMNMGEYTITPSSPFLMGPTIKNVDPQFTNAAAGDYSLKATSPAIDAGNNALFSGLTNQTKDLAGNLRLRGSTIDMGAYEATPVSTPPNITSVTVPPAKTYITNDYLEFVINFDQNVIVNTSGGTSRIEIEMGTSTVYANYVNGTGGTALLFRYIVETGDIDEDGIVLKQLQLNGGTIKNESSDVANLTLNNVATTAGVKVFAKELVVQGVERADGSPTKQLIVNYVVNFSRAVTGVLKSDFNFTTTGNVSGAISGVSTSDNIKYVVTINNISGNGTLRLDVVNTGNIQDAVGNKLAAAFTGGETYVIDHTAPLAPTGAAAIAGNSNNKLTWTANTETDVTSYRIYWGTTNDPTTLLTTITTSPFTHIGLANGTTYYYRIAAVDAVGNESIGSTVISATPKAPQTISFNAINKTYGDVDFDGDAVATSGLDITYLSDNPAVATIVNGKIHIIATGTANITARQPGNNAYLAASDQVRTLTVAPKALVLTAIATDKVYDTNKNAVVSWNDNRVLGDMLTISYESATFDNKHVGTNKSVTVNGISLGGTDAGNYTFNTSANTNANITPAAITVTAAALDKVYDGNNNATVTLLANSLDGDNVTVTYGSAAFDNKHVRANKSVDVNGISLSGTDAANYTFNTTASATANITPAPLTVTAVDKNKVYGTADPALTYLVKASDLKNGDASSVVSGELERVGGENIGPYAINNKNLTAANYMISYMPAVLTIGKAPLTVTAVDKTKVYGTADPTLTYLVKTSDLKNGDASSVVSGELERVGGENVGPYAINNKNLTAANYMISYTPASLTIGKAPLTVTAVDKNKVYGTTDPALTYLVKASDLKNGDASSVVSGELERVGGENVGEYTIEQGTLAASSNYTIEYTVAKLKITKATLSGLDLANIETIYDGSTKSLRLTGTLPQGVNVVYQNNDKINAGSYEVTALINESLNYFGTSIKGMLTIHKAKQTLTFNAPQTLRRDAGIVALDASSSSGLPVDLSVDDPMIAKIKENGLEVLRLGTVRITATQAGNENYEASNPVTVSVRIANDASAALPILVHKAVSPNGDGINEFLMLEGVGDYPDNKVTIFDKSGVVLKEIVGYDNRSNVFTGEYHRDGTYYYYLDIKDGSTWKREKGFFVIKR